MIRFSVEQLQRFKTPLGRLIPGGPKETMPRLRMIVEQSRPSRVIAVGDVVSKEAESAGIRLNLGIVDGRTMRREYAPQSGRFKDIFHVSNPAGTITDEAWETIKIAMKQKEAMIIVDGEEDLLALPAIIEAPDNSLIVYGQPSAGIVIIMATPEKKESLRRLLGEITSRGQKG